MDNQKEYDFIYELERTLHSGFIGIYDVYKINNLLFVVWKVENHFYISPLTEIYEETESGYVLCEHLPENVKVIQ